jgi:PAS domain S-box-containing protein
VSFFEVNMDYVYLISGLAFVSLGVVAMVLSIERDRTLPWWELASYSLASGIVLWGTMVAHDLGDTPGFAWMRLFVVAFGFLSLFEFGRRGLSRRFARVPGVWLSLAAGATVVVGAIVGGVDAADRLAHIVILLPAGAGAALAMASAARRPGTVGHRALLAAGVVIGTHAIVIGAAGASVARWGCCSPTLIAGLLPLQLIYATVAATAGSLLLVYSSRRRLALDPTLTKRRAFSRLWLVPATAVILFVGGYAVTVATGQADRADRETLLERAETAALSVDTRLVRTLTASPSDARTSDWATVRGELEAIHRANPDVRYVHLARMAGGTLRFLVDSRAGGLHGVSAPGAEVLGASPLFRRLATGSGAAEVEGPWTDPWGTWVTVLVPLRDPDGTFVGLLGMDVPAAHWTMGLADYRLIAILLVLVVSVITLSFVAAMYISRDAGRRTKASEARLAAILGGSPEGLAIVEPGSGTVLFANTALEEMLGVPAEELRGAEMTALFGGDDAETRLAIAGDGVSVEQRQLATRDLRLREVEITCLPIDLDEGRKRLIYIHDITVAKAAERDLRDRITLENIIRAVSSRFLAADSADANVVVDEALATLGTFLEVDRAYLTRVSRDRFITRTHEWCALGIPPLSDDLGDVPLDDFPWFAAQLEAREPVHVPNLDSLPPAAAAELAMLSRQGVRSRVVVPMTENDRLVGHLTLDNVREEREWSGERIALLTVFSDILAVGIRRAKAETELAKLTMAVTNSPAATVITDVDGNIEYVNPRFREASGYSGAELIGENPRILKSGEMDEAVYEELWRVIASGGDWRGEFVNRRKDGTHYAVTASISPVRDFAGLVHYVCVQEDITALKIAQEELRRAVDTAEAANHAKSDFLATMSHEIRTPMNAIIGMAELLEDTPLNDEQERYIRIFRSAGESLLTLINDILDLSKIEAGAFDMEAREFNVEQLMEETAEILLMRASEKGIELLVDVAGATPDRMHGDPDRVRQVLVNLIGNAIKFTETGHVLLRVDTVDAGDVKTVRFAVTDTGIGIPSEKLETIFEAFTQADSSTTRKYGGTGLGLTISRRLVELMGGRLTASSEVGVGSTFAFTLPAPEALAVRTSDTADDHQLAGVRALVVDDSAINRLVLRRYLERAGATVDEAPDGRGGIERLRAAPSRYDVVLTDLRMPDMSGFGVAEAVAGDGAIAGVPVIVLSSDARPGDSERAVKAGAVTLLVKPVRRRTLLDAVAAIIAARAAAQPFVDTVEPPVIPKRPFVDTPSRAMDILLVEDTDDGRMLALAYMKGQQHRTVTAENGQEAVAAYAAAGMGGFDVVLMDMQMPVMDGYAATRRIREIEAASSWPHTPIVALTAFALAEETTRALAAGCDDYLTKPIKKATLLAALAKHTEA